jgi:mono/diheme cytochrome c family protein
VRGGPPGLLEGESMRRAFVLLAAAVAFIAAATSQILADDPAQAPAPVARPAAATPNTQAVAPVLNQRELVQKYCITCHSERAKTGGLVLENLDPAETGAHADIWEKVVRKVRGGMMPPQGLPRPDVATLDAFAAALENSLDQQALRQPNPGHKPVHRLNRTEYGNAIRDILDLELDVTELLPPDDESNGFDNIAGALRVSPSLLEQYLAASRKISALAVGTDKDLLTIAYRVPPDDSQEDHVDGLPLGTRGGLLFKHTFPQDADYQFNVFLLRNIVGYMTGLEFAHDVEISIDGERVFVSQVGGTEDNLASDTNMSETADKIDERLKTKVPITAGPHTVGVAFIRRNYAESDEPLQPHERNHDLQDMNGLPMIDHVTVSGPYNPKGPGDTPSRRRVFVCRPPSLAVGSGEGEAGCAKRILSTLARRAYRRPVTEADMAPVMEMYAAGRRKGTFEAGIEQGLRFVLASPKFLFRTESAPTATAAGRDPRPVDAGSRVTDLELASRLSFFLWSTVPDEELITVAAGGRLKQPVVLEQQIKRMLRDPKARALVDNFASQWLMLRNLKSHQPTPGDFPNWDNELRHSFRTETELFFRSIIEEDRSAIDLINADYTFVNERLARHYGIPGVYGSQFRRVKLTDDNRRGLLGQGSILTVTSQPDRTSVVLRGKWILENILGTPPPAPPADVNTNLPQDQAEPKSLRQLMERHRASPTCASCHRVMDPLGFALENFDGVGEWRVKEKGGTIDSSGQLADGSIVDGPVSLRKALLKRPEMFVRVITEKLMTYALGRGVEYYDMPTVRGITRDAAKQNYRFSSIVLGIVKSPAFQMKTTTAGHANLTARN